eukprot:COSAG04_NODE_18947_length_428_cov_1.258359_1_plen_142_part_11
MHDPWAAGCARSGGRWGHANVLLAPEGAPAAQPESGAARAAQRAKQACAPQHGFGFLKGNPVSSCDLIIRHYQVQLYMPQPRPSDLIPVYRASPISPEGRRLVQHLRTKTASSKADPPTSPPQRVAEGDHPASASRGIVARS